MIAEQGAVWMIGCGTMGGAMLRRWIGAGLPAERVTVVTRSPAVVPSGVRALHTIPSDEQPDILVLAVKPQQLDAVAPALAAVAPRLLVSILAGVEQQVLRTRFAAEAVVRAMPNLPVAIGQGVTALFSNDADSRTRARAEALFRPLGTVEWIDREDRFDAVTALAGSGPAFLFRFVDALARGGVALGLAADQAERLALATVAGAGAMAAQADLAPGVLADQVASAGGSTRKGLDILDAEGGLLPLVTRTLAAAERRNRELASAARAAS